MYIYIYIYKLIEFIEPTLSLNFILLLCQIDKHTLYNNNNYYFEIYLKNKIK